MRRGAFTLVEMLTVMGIIVVLISLVGPVVNSIKGANDVSKAVYDIAGVLAQSRAYAMSNNTYVYVGIEEVDVNVSDSVNPQVDGPGKQGRIGIAVIASKDGTTGYNLSDPTNSWKASYGATGGSYSNIGKVQTFDQLHLVNLGERPDTGGMSRPPLSDTAAIDSAYNLGDQSCSSVTWFSYPLGTSMTGGKYVFKKVIQFSPQGVARIQTGSNSDIVAPWIEIGIQQTHGNGQAETLKSKPTTGSIAAIQINGVTGAVRIYRP